MSNLLDSWGVNRAWSDGLIGLWREAPGLMTGFMTDLFDARESRALDNLLKSAETNSVFTARGAYEEVTKLRLFFSDVSQMFIGRSR